MKNSNTNAVIARPGESKQACDNAGNANDDEPEARTHLATRAGHRAPQGKKAVGYRVGPPQERECQQGDDWPGKSQNAKGYGCETAQQYEPPVVCHGAQQCEAGQRWP
ncbi:MAG: hypothetical protein WA781_09710 [Pseudolabrys sp.]